MRLAKLAIVSSKMSDQYSLNPHLILPPGTKVVVKVDALGPNGKAIHDAGALAIVVQSPVDHQHAYRVRFHDGFEASFKRAELASLSHWQRESAGGTRGDASAMAEFGLNRFVILRSVVGSRAYGLATADSDTDRRGVYLPPAELHWSLYGVPE